MNIRKIKFKLTIIILFSLIFFACSYSGEGEFSSSGVWPFKTYRLSLPAKKAVNKKVISYNIQGFKSHNLSWVLIVLKKKDAKFSENDKKILANVEVKIRFRNQDGSVFYSNKKRFASYRGVIEGDIGYFRDRLKIPGQVFTIEIIPKNISSDLNPLQVEVKLVSSWK